MTASLIHTMYIAYYQRPADPAGLAYWQAQLTANGGGEAGWNAVAAAFANAAESTALYGSQTLSQKISAIYLAAFERAAVESEVTYWANSGFSEAQIAFAIVNGAQNDDLSTVNAKEAYAVNFVATIDPAGTGVGPFSYEYNDPSVGRSLMDVVTKDSDTSVATVAAQVQANVPTLNTVALTSGADTITPSDNAVDYISAAIGGSAPTLGRTDQVDGGSANDVMTITTDGNFLLGFSTGYIKNVETINFDTTITSVTTKLINLTGVSGVSTYNVGASKAIVKLSEVSDVGGTINLSGQTTGNFEVAFASGAISGTGSSMTIGVSDVGTTGDAVQMLTQGVTDLTIVASGNTESFVDLSNSSNDYQTLSVIGSGDLYIEDIGSNASVLSASSFQGDLTFTIDSDTNTEIGASGKTITGGAGTDTMRLMGSGIIGASTTSIEEISFDGSSGEAIVRATGMAGITTISFSGQNAENAASISGLVSGDRTINAIMDGGSVQTTYSAGGDLTVNLNVDSARIAAELITDNDFKLKATNTGAVAINVGSYVSAAGTLTLSNATGVTVAVDTTGNFGNTIKADLASTITVTGGADIGATISGAAASTISLNVGSGTVNVGSTALTTFALTNSGSVEISSASRMSGVQTITVDTQKMANLANLATTGLQTLQISGSGTLAAASFGVHSAGSTDLTISLTGLGGGFSANELMIASGSITLAGADSDGAITVTGITASGLTVTTGTIQNYTNEVSVLSDSFVLEGAASTSSSTSAAVSLGTITASAGITISLGAGTGLVSAGALFTDGAMVLDASKFNGKLNIPNVSGSGVTISLGLNGNMSSTNIESVKAFTLDGSASGSADIAVGSISASTNLTISLGSGSGSLSVADDLYAGGSIVIDASKNGGTLDLAQLTASGLTVSLGTVGDFSASLIDVEGGGFTLDGANSQSASVVIGTMSASAAATISLGSGSGSMVASSLVVAGALTIDGSGNKYDGTMDVTVVSASGVSIATGTRGDFSAQTMVSTKNVVFDGSISTSAQVTLGQVTAVGSITVSMGSGSGSLSTLGLDGQGAAVMDASKFAGVMEISKISASGVTISTGTLGDFSGSVITSTKAFTLDGAAGLSAQTTINALQVSGAATITLGSAGSGALTMLSASVAGAMTIDASGTMADIEQGEIIAVSGVSVVTGTDGDYSAEIITSTGGGFVLDASNASSADITINELRLTASNTDSSLTFGSGGGTFSAAEIASNGDFTIDASKSNATFNIQNLTASGITVSLAGPASFSAASLSATKGITIDATAATSADISLNAVTASAGISISVAGSAEFSAQTIDNNSTFTMSAAGASESIDIRALSASGVSITLGTQGDLSASSIISNAAVTIDGSGSTTAQGITIGALHVNSGAVTISAGSGSGDVSILTASAANSFSFDGTRFDGEVSISDIRAGSGISVTIGSGGDYSASAIESIGEGFTFNSRSDEASGELVTIGTISASGITMNMASKAFVDVDMATAGAGAGTFTFSGSTFNGSLGIDQLSGSAANIITGANFSFSAGSVVVTESFTLNGGSLTSADLFINTISASSGISMSFGSMSGSAVFSSLTVTTGDMRFSAESAAGLSLSVQQISASALQVTLGEASDSDTVNSMFSASVVTADNFTLDATAYRDQMYFGLLSASAVTITAGDLTDELVIGGMSAVTVDINGGSGSKFSATMSSVTISGSAWSIVMPELGNGLTIPELSFGKAWTIKGTADADQVSASATNAAGSTVTIDFDFREDSAADLLGIASTQGGGGVYGILRNFDGFGGDVDTIDLTYSAHNAATHSTANAAALIGDVLGSTLTATDLTTVHSAGYATSMFSYNGDTYWVYNGSAGTASSFDNGDIVLRFVGNTSTVGEQDII